MTNRRRPCHQRLARKLQRESPFTGLMAPSGFASDSCTETLRIQPNGKAPS